MNFAVMNNKGHVLDIYDNPTDAQARADELNDEQLPDLFAWIEQTTDTTPADMPGQGIFW